MLVVLSVLSLFMMLGITYVIMASRARALSRGFASMTTGGPESRLPVRNLLDEAAMLIIRGKPLTLTSGTLPARLGTSDSFQFESILADQYGYSDPFSGTTSSAVQGAGPLCSTTVSFTGSTPAHGLDLAGCVLTLLPKTGKASSHRILRAEPAAALTGAPVRLVFANFNNDFERSGTTTSGTGFTFPAAGTDFKINRRVHSGTGTTSGTSAFTVNEPWDGLDYPANSFIAHVEPVPLAPSSANIIRPSMFPVSMATALNDGIASNDDLDNDGVDDRADNDNDGIYDGWFFDPGFPEIYSSNGNEILVHMSCLVLDMDGRLNVNAHGSVAHIAASGTATGSVIYPDNDSRWGALSGSSAIPNGSGYGPAEINGAKVFSALTGTNPIPDNPWASILVGARSPQFYSGAARDRITPATYPSTIGIEGRYGHEANSLTIATGTLSALSGTASGRLPLAGFNGVDDSVGKDNERTLIAVSGTNPASANQWTVDLHGRMKTLATGTPAFLTYVKPDTTCEYQDDPYEIRLDYSLRRSGLNDARTSGTAASPMADHPFSLAAFERVLRPYDADSRSLPGRLAALLGSQAEASRLVVTTDSWDTISLTGTASDRVYAWFKSATTGNLFEGGSAAMQNGTQLPDNRLPWEFAAGQRLDLTRFLDSTGPGIGRKLLFKDLYMAAVALSAALASNPSADLAAKCAQWAANVIEYQDPDSIMTGYEYDPTPLAAWDVDGDISTQEPGRAIVWGAERPELVIAQTVVSNTNQLHVVLNHPWNAVFSTGTVSTVAEPVASELRGSAPGNVNLIGTGSSSAGTSAIWQLQVGNGTPIPFTASTSSTNTEVGPGDWAVLSPPSSFSISTGTAILSGSLTLAGLQATATTVKLLRLADPTQPHEAIGSGSAANPYLVVDSLAVPPAPVGTGTFSYYTRNGWSNAVPPTPTNTTTIPSATWGGIIPWLSWPNRPLISPAELLLVPGFTGFSTGTSGTTGLLTNYVPPSATNSSYLPNTSGTSTADWTALDVFTVPSRFAGTRQTVDMTGASAFRDDLTQMRAGIYGSGSANHQLPSQYNQLSLGREPGRVNVNTIASDAVWDAVIAGWLPAPIATRSGSSSASLTTAPAKTVAATLALSGASSAIRTDTIPDASLNPYHQFYTALRLGNTATVRSHVFGIWVTVRTMETTGTGSPPPVDRDTVQYHRMFLLFDRSIPVAFEPGKNHNVHNAILLQRVIE